ncbi:DUF5313 family protein [Cellulomonas sp. URHB0016]
MTGVDRRFERSVAFWLRAYPRRWRAARSAEVQSVAADLAGPGAARLDVRSAAGMVVGGWATRWRTRPPLHDYLLYAGFDRRIPARYRAWAADDLEGPLFALRLVLRGPALAVLIATVVTDHGRLPTDLTFVGIFVTVLAATWLTFGPRRLESLRRKHLVPQQGEPVVGGTRVYDWVPRDRVAAIPGTLAALLCTAVVGVVATSAGILARHGVVFVACPGEPGDACVETVSRLRDGIGPVGLDALVVAVAVGAVAAWLAAGRLRRTVARRPVQTDRRLVGFGVRRTAAAASVGALVLADLLAEATGRIDLWAAPVVAVLALALLPATVVGWRAARHGPADLAWSDVCRMACTGRPPAVDQRATGLVAVPVALAAHRAASGAAVPGPVVPDHAEAPGTDWLH